MRLFAFHAGDANCIETAILRAGSPRLQGRASVVLLSLRDSLSPVSGRVQAAPVRGVRRRRDARHPATRDLRHPAASADYAPAQAYDTCAGGHWLLVAKQRALAFLTQSGQNDYGEALQNHRQTRRDLSQKILCHTES